MDISKTFHAKLLLFGEYGVTCNSMGLSVPFPQYAARFSFANSESTTSAESIRNLKEFFKHLIKLKNSGELFASLDLDAFDRDLQNGLYFQSEIPQGYGVGSSGALCAAIYDRYAVNKLPIHDEKDLIKLRKMFIQMESYFHGISSGLDPLACYSGKPLLIKSSSEITYAKMPDIDADKLTIFLIDTRKTGKTEPLVNWFFHCLSHNSFYKKIDRQFIPLINHSIDEFINGNLPSFFKNVSDLSLFTLENLKPMIPEGFEEIWKKGIESGDYYLKLCGSGGGGYLIGFAQNPSTANKLASKHGLDVLTFKGKA